MVTRGELNAHSGIFIPTDMTAAGGASRLSKRHEIQLNSTEKEKRQTGRLYAVADSEKSPLPMFSGAEPRDRVPPLTVER